MNTDETVKQLKREIRDTEKSLAFWNDQVKLQARTPLEGTVRNIAKSYEAQLQRLRNAERIIASA